MKRNFLYYLFFFTMILVGSVNGSTLGETMRYQNIKDVPVAKWRELAKKKIYFGHQSVGVNIVDGMKEVLKEYPEIHLNILESRKGEVSGGAFIHSKVGENRRPNTKINDFVNVINDELAIVPDVAALKFCYVDAYDKVDVKAIFQEYKYAMAKLKKEHSGLTIIHFTMPLRTQSISWKIKAKLLLGKDIWEFEDNVKRNEFNKLLLQAYLGKEPVFDIARFEATSGDGSITGFKYDGDQYLSMNPEFSSDGGHLNSFGSKMIAEQLLLFFVNEI